MARLVKTIEGEIVPRLVMARRASGSAETSGWSSREPDETDVRELVRVLLTHELAVAAAFVDTVRQRGASLEAVCLGLLAPAARELGLLWEEDECDFMQVTVGLCRLHHLLRELSPEFRADGAERDPERNILLTCMPGDQHTFGVALVAQFLRKAGWEVWHESPVMAGEILDLVRQQCFMMLGLSVGHDSRVDDVAALISAVRQASRNRAIGIMVGGPLLVAQPGLAAQMGADATAIDGHMAVLCADDICTCQSGNLRGSLDVMQ